VMGNDEAVVAARSRRSDLIAFEDRDAADSAVARAERRGEPGETAADHEHVDRYILLQRRRGGAARASVLLMRSSRASINLVEATMSYSEPSLTIECSTMCVLPLMIETIAPMTLETHC
jgi:hypothetical protein